MREIKSFLRRPLSKRIVFTFSWLIADTQVCLNDMETLYVYKLQPIVFLRLGNYALQVMILL